MQSENITNAFLAAASAALTLTTLPSFPRSLPIPLPHRHWRLLYAKAGSSFGQAKEKEID